MTTIVAVDDSATMRRVLEMTFANTEFELTVCDSAAAALEKVKALRPALVVADVSLPPTDGYELCATLKLASPQVPVLMLSSKQHPFEATRGAQADGNLDKPFDTQVMLDRVRELVASAAAMPAAEEPRAAARPAPSPASPQSAMPQRAKPRAPVPAASGRLGARPEARPEPRPDPRSPDGDRPTMTHEWTKRGGLAPGVDRTQPLPGRNELAASDMLGRGASPPRQAVARTPAPASGLSRTSPGLTPEPPSNRARSSRPSSDKARGGTFPGVPAPPPAMPAPRAPAAAGARASSDGADASMRDRLNALGLTGAQVEGVLALSREVVEQAVWEVVPMLAETLIKEEIARLTQD